MELTVSSVLDLVKAIQSLNVFYLIPALLLITYALSTLVFLRSRRSNAPGQIPPTLPYWLYGFYHVFGLAYYGYGYFTKTLREYGNSAPWIVRAGPVPFLIITDPNHVKKIYQSAKLMSSKVLMIKVYENTMGLPKNGMDLIVNEDPTVAHVHKVMSRQYLTGVALNSLAKVYLELWQKNLAAMNLDKEEWTEIPDLLMWVRHFDDNLEVYTVGLPRFMAPSAHAKRDKFINSLKSWVENLENSDVYDQIGVDDPIWDPEFGSKFIRHRVRDLSRAGMNLESCAVETMAITHGPNGNTHPSSFWCIFEIFKDLNLRDALTDPILQHYDGRSRSYDIEALSAIPLIQSIHMEVARLRMPSVTARSCDTSDFVLDEKYIVPKGTSVMMLSHALALNTEAWAEARPHTVTKPLTEFWGERFLVPEKSAEGENSSMKFSVDGINGLIITFGGGQNLCPGRNLAKMVHAATISVLLTEYEVELLDPAGAQKLIPSVPIAMGLMRPKGSIPFRIRRRSTTKN